MFTNDLDSWAAFKDMIAQIVSDTETKKKLPNFGHISCPLYRGHASSSWGLESTLERSGFRNMAVNRYYDAARSASRYLENFEGHRFQLTPRTELTFDGMNTSMPDYEFLAFLRHHGFPSPLLDWSQSPYVAAFFAFSNPAGDSERVAIFVYQEYYGCAKAWDSQKGTIRTNGPWAAIHERHILQQSWYSYAVKELVTDGKNGPEITPIFCPHEEVFTVSSSLQGRRQDVLAKFTIPRSERRTALRELFQMNITPYSLFRSTDALVSTVGLKIFDDIG